MRALRRLHSSPPAMSGFGFRQKASALLAKAEGSFAERGWDTELIKGARSRITANQSRVRSMPGENNTQRSNLAIQPGERLQIELLPGYAALRGTTDDPRIDVLVQGSVSKTRPDDRASRSQRIFLSATKSLVGLAKLPEAPSRQNSTESQLNRKGSSFVTVSARPELAAGPAGVDGRPDPKNSAYEQLLDLGQIEDEPEELEAQLEKELADLELHERKKADGRPPASRTSTGNLMTAGDAADLEVLHQNLRERLRGFLAQPLESRHVRVTVRDATTDEAFATGLILSDEEGVFKHVLPIRAPGKPGLKLRVSVELQMEQAERQANTGEHRLSEQSLLEVYRSGCLRVVSDIDDTCKHTQVLSSTRNLLRNVLTRPYSEVTVPGMKEWYQAMAKIGGAYHYVSNAPTQVAPVVKGFLVAAELPAGHLTLKKYAKGSGLLSGLWQPAGARKRQNVEAILSAFPDSPFILIGDSGEQDLELYSELAGLYKSQILAIFIRDVTTPSLPSPRSSGRTGSVNVAESDDEALTMTMSKTRVSKIKAQPASTPSMSYEGSDDALSPNNPLASQAVTSRQKLLIAFQARLAAAQQRLPDGIVLRIFKDGYEVKDEALQLIKHALADRKMV